MLNVSRAPQSIFTDNSSVYTTANPFTAPRRRSHFLNALALVFFWVLSALQAPALKYLVVILSAAICLGLAMSGHGALALAFAAGLIVAVLIVA